jgi:hypothetical protein
MSRRRFTSTGVLAVVVAAMSMVSISIAGQAPTDTRAPAAVALDKAKASLGTAYTQPKTPWGDPDLQGVWSYATTTPLSRSDETRRVGLQEGPQR